MEFFFEEQAAVFTCSATQDLYDSILEIVRSVHDGRFATGRFATKGGAGDVTDVRSLMLYLCGAYSPERTWHLCSAWETHFGKQPAEQPQPGSDSTRASSCARTSPSLHRPLCLVRPLAAASRGRQPMPVV